MASNLFADLARRYRVTNGASFNLKDFDPDETPGLDSKEEATRLLQETVQRMGELQERLYAQDRWSVLLIFQAMDAAGKDSTIKHVMSGVNPQGCHVASFKQPSTEELDHDYLWRVARHLPERGRIGIFNRSYYEEVLIVRVHPELLSKQRLPEPLISKKIWQQRYEDIRNFEQYLGRQGTVIRKFFLNVSKEEQRRRFLERLEEPEKNWKFSLADVHEREHWRDYQRAYQDLIQHTATKDAPWYVVPADHKWFTRIVVGAAIVEALESIRPTFPKLAGDTLRDLGVAKAALESE
jgi:PPK2 family polyphosphate:nucleotide phosphotransferase